MKLLYDWILNLKPKQIYYFFTIFIIIICIIQLSVTDKINPYLSAFAILLMIIGDLVFGIKRRRQLRNSKSESRPGRSE